jgi:DNA-binding SARP family transcriptional activator
VADSETEFCLLGPLELRSGGLALPVLPGKQRALLAALLLKPNKAVPLDELVEAIWATDPPASAYASIRNFVKALRAALGDACGSRVRTVPGGYTVAVEAGELDIARFTALLDRARELADDAAWQEAALALNEALSLWRGEPLADVPSQWLTLREVPRLTELRLQALEARCVAGLQLGRQADVIADLRQMIALHPLRERLHALLMLALYWNGQQAAALAAYQHARAMLVQELATEPGPELQELHQQVLVADPALTGPKSPRLPGRLAGHAVPRELPAPVGHFTGRAAELAELSAMAADGQGRALIICAVDGTAGVGKTALAVQWAHRVLQRFPDGQLYVNLRGYDPAEPVAAGDALAGFLRTLGVPGKEIPDGVQDRARLYRSSLAGRRMLVLLDNARDAEHVRLLLPGDPGSLVLVTSRDTLAGLVAADGARRLDLDVLPLADSVALLRSLIGPRADHEPEAVAALAERCARLPLALRIAAELAVARRQAQLKDLVAELAATRLDGLAGGDDRADVRAVFTWSFRQLPDDAARAFALIGLHPGADLDVHAAAALTGTAAGQARRLLGRLHRARMLQVDACGRYSMHDLMRVYAREQAAAADTDGQSRHASTRLFDYYLSAAAAAMDVLFPAEADRRPRVRPVEAVLPAMPGQVDARAWLDGERANLVAAVVHCSGHGWSRHATDLARTLHRYLITGNHLPEAHTICIHELQAAGRSEDLAAEASALSGFGMIAIEKGRFHDAAGHYQAALERYCRYGDRTGQARALANLGIAQQHLHDQQSAADYYRQAIAAYEEARDRRGVASVMCSFSLVEDELGSHDLAREHLKFALQSFRDQQDQLREAEALAKMGILSLRRGQPRQAADYHQQSLAVYRSIGSRTGVAIALHNLGEISLRQGECQQAVSYLQQAITLLRNTGYQYGEITALRALADALHGADRPAAARAELATALRLAAETGNTYQLASAHRDLAESHCRARQHEQARHHWQQALALYTQLGSPEADRVSSRLGGQKAEGQG